MPNQRRPGFFITLEGVDGAGKSTQAKLLDQHLQAAGHDTLLTREPGGAPGAEDIRRLLVEGAPGRWSAKTELLLFTAARRDHVERTIAPALERGIVVICDRFVDSTRAYQGDSDLRAAVDQLHRMMIGLDPDLTLIFDLDGACGLARTSGREGSEDRFERRGAAFQNALRARYTEIAKAEPERCRMVDADRPQETIAAQVRAIVMPLLGRR